MSCNIKRHIDTRVIFGCELGFPQLKPTDVYEDNIGYFALANHMHLRGRSKHIALRVCFIQKLIQDGLINVKQCPNAVQTLENKLCLAYNLKLYGSASRRQAHWRQNASSFGPSQATCVCFQVWFGLLQGLTARPGLEKDCKYPAEIDFPTKGTRLINKGPTKGTRPMWPDFPATEYRGYTPIRSWICAIVLLCCVDTLLTRGWGRLETRPEVALKLPWDLLQNSLSILSFFLGFRRPNLITGLSGWRTPD